MISEKPLFHMWGFELLLGKFISGENKLVEWCMLLINKNTTDSLSISGGAWLPWAQVADVSNCTSDSTVGSGGKNGTLTVLPGYAIF